MTPVEDVRAWLDANGFGRFATLFEDNEIDGEALLELNDEHLKELGIPLGARVKLLKAIDARRASGADEPQPAANGPRERGSEAERRQLTVMFVDLVGSTELSRHLDPEDMSEVMRAYHRRTTEVIRRWDGHVAKYLGDGVLAYFGWPRAHEDDAERAVRAGLGIAEAVAGIEDGTGEKLAVRVGIATGPVVVGELIGEGTAQEQAVVGETPNLAGRLQTLADPDGVMISEATRRLLGELFELEGVSDLPLKGFEGKTKAFRVIAEGRSESRFEATRGRQLTPLVGREQELALLLDRWSRAKNGEGQVVLLSGEAGIGKSRLLQALRERLRGEPHMALSHYGSAHHTDSAFHPITHHIERAAGFTREDSNRVRLEKLRALLGASGDESEPLVPLLASLAGVDLEDGRATLDLTPQRRKQLTIDALVDQVQKLARGRPVLVIYEDAHWFDPTTLEVVGNLIERTAELRVLVLVAHRSDFTPPWPGHGHVTALSLPRLARREGAAMMARLSQERPLPSHVEAALLVRTDGIPLFVEELTKAVLESGVLELSGDRPEEPLPAVAIPASLHDSLMARLDRLATVREVAQIASVIGREFPYNLLAAVAGWSEDDLVSALDRLETVELIYRRGRPPEATYTFKHALVQDAAYQSLLKSRRQELHARMAAAIERDHPITARQEPELLAYHFARAGDAGRAIVQWQAAARRARERSAHQEAILHLQKALGLLEGLPDPEGRVGLEIELRATQGSVLIPLRGQASPEVGAAFAEAEALCIRLGETSRLYPILQGLWHFHAVRAELDKARELATRCHEIALRDRDPALHLAAHVVLCGSLCWAGEFRAACHHLDLALALENEAPGRSEVYSIGADLKVFMRGFGSYALWSLGHAERAERLSKESLDLGQRSNDPFSLAMASNHAALLHQLGGDHRRVDELAGAASEHSSEHQFAYYLALATFLRGWAVAAAGKGDGGVEAMRRGLSAMEDTGCRLRRPYCLGLLASAQVGAGQPETGLAMIADAIEIARRTGERWRDSDLQRTRGNLLLAHSRKRTNEAEACFRTALQIAHSQDARSLELRAALDLARLWAEQGERRKAHDLLAPVYSWFTEGFETKDLAEAGRLLDELA